MNMNKQNHLGSHLHYNLPVLQLTKERRKSKLMNMQKH